MFKSFDYDSIIEYYEPMSQTKLAQKGGEEMICKERREELGLTCAEVERKLGIKRTSVNKWENGNYFPRGQTLMKYAEFLGLTADEVLSAISIKKASRSSP